MNNDKPIEGEHISKDDDDYQDKVRSSNGKTVLRRNAWPDSLRGVPAHIVTSGLFRPNPGKNRKLLDKEKIGSVEGHEIYYSGFELSMQDDWKVIKNLIQLQKGFSIEDGFSFDRTEFVKEVFGNRSSFYYDKLLECLERLSSGNLRLTSKDKTMNIRGVSLVRKFIDRDETTNKTIPVWHVWLEPEVVRLLEEDIAFTGQKDSNKLSPQTIKIKDLLLNTSPNKLIYAKDIKDDLLHSGATDENFKKMLLGRYSDQLIAAGVTTKKLKLDANGVLLYELVDETYIEEVGQLELFDVQEK